jgi:hypothetical protein
VAAVKQVAFKPGDIFFWAGGHIKYQGDCVRGEPPKDTKSWAIVGRPDLGWMAIARFNPATRLPWPVPAGGAHHDA